MLFNVPEMSCGHCEKSIREALVKLDARAEVAVDLQSRQVDVQGLSAGRDAVISALAAIGFEAVEIQ